MEIALRMLLKTHFFLGDKENIPLGIIKVLICILSDSVVVYDLIQFEITVCVYC